MATSNFLQWNPNKTNQQADGAYTAEALRLNGASDGNVCYATMDNKFRYQVTTFIVAMANAMVAKGYDMSDVSVSTLQAQLANILTQADAVPYHVHDERYYTETEVNALLAGIVTVPVGAVFPWATGTVPTGYLECNGASISRTTYASLFGVLSDDYGAVSGSVFNLPDYRGRFIRGWDHAIARDPDRATRTNRGDGTVGDYVGTLQASAIASHRHIMSVGAGSSGGYGEVGANYTGIHATQFTSYFGTSTETRPENINAMYIIKY